ncbi:DUF6334 family protein [uncultured Microbulbifer sp.]|uniref:DUF6334 family protein n=1 Tax=uncultured Microbulbifer sp. TaxID=348147 RepID=UPI0026286856|nr:DUF6334 family protein [uncultured Microbulbifer sp.]
MNLSDLVEGAGKLESVEPFSYPKITEDIQVIRLNFHSMNCDIYAIEETDEIRLQESMAVEGMVVNKRSTVFQVCVGSELLWAWDMTNNQGFSDALKFEFKNGVSVELVVVASSIKQFYVKEL